jgi:hypothetical protein
LKRASLRSWATSGIVDGHDFGSGEFNVFVLTDAPAKVFQDVQDAVKNQSHALQTQMRVAYRQLGADEFTVLWPVGLKEFHVA